MLTAHLAAIVDSSDDAIISKDLQGVIRSWNAGAAAIFGYAAEEVVGGPIQILFPPDRLGEEDLIMRRLRRGERVDHFETVRRRRDGTDFHASVTISPIRDADGAIVGASKILRDIDASYRAQLDLRKAKLDLEAVVLERTKALAERDLLLREVYHRVKNNLQVVDALLMMQANRIEDPLAKDALNGLRGRVVALGLVHQQLMSSADLKTFDVGPFLEELTGNVVGGAAARGIRLKVDALPLEVGLDFAVPLGLLVTEIVTNSLKHAFPSGEGEVCVSLRADDGGRVALRVADNGKGLAQGADGPPKRGSGLDIIKKLVAQLDGEMTVRQDGGTITDISFPAPKT